MKTYQFNDMMGSRGRGHKSAIVYDGKVYELHEAEKLSLCVVRELSYEKRGKFSNSDIQVTVNTASLVTCMQPFDYWSESLQDCIEHVQTYSENEIGYRPTAEEAELFFSVKYPKTYEGIKKKDEKENKLV